MVDQEPPPTGCPPPAPALKSVSLECVRPRREQETYSAQCTWRDAELLWFLLLSDCSASQCQASVCVHCGHQSLLTQTLTLWVLQPAEPGSPGLQPTSLIFAGDTVRLCFGSPCCFTCFHREISRIQEGRCLCCHRPGTAH